MMQAVTVLMAALWMFGAHAHAQPPAKPGLPDLGAEIGVLAVVTLKAPAAPDEEAALGADELDALRGGEVVVSQTTTQNMTATNSGNAVTARRVESGDINLAADAFSGYGGIGNFVMNTGHNNNLQGSISVSIVMTPQ
jgi:hypothetical protein